MQIRSNQDEARELSTIIALYRPDHTIEKLAVVTSEAEGWQTVSSGGGFTLPAQLEGYYVKVFVWDSMDSMQPLGEAIMFP